MKNVENERENFLAVKNELNEVKSRHEELAYCYEAKISDLTAMLYEQESTKRKENEEIRKLQVIAIMNYSITSKFLQFTCTYTC